MTGFEPRTSGIGSDRSTTEPQPLPNYCYYSLTNLLCISIFAKTIQHEYENKMFFCLVRNNNYLSKFDFIVEVLS